MPECIDVMIPVLGKEAQLMEVARAIADVQYMLHIMKEAKSAGASMEGLLRCAGAWIGAQDKEASEFRDNKFALLDGIMAMAN
ncbi:hypothetical protein HDV00_000890 [Rhizophlyctis rosea]|nr:hypothetical protein HDV00_000890 [Rhizophlyctis rosea]